MKQHVYAVVRDASNTYTATADGVRASSTTGAEWAARRLGEKIFGGRFLKAVQLPAAVGDGIGITRWRLTGEEAPAAGAGYVDCGECPRISTGCSGRCEKGHQ